MSNDGPFSIPTIRGRIAEKLETASPRVDEGADEMSFPPAPEEIPLRTSEERGAVALACLILENLREQGGTRAPKRPLETVLRKTLATFGPKEVMDIEVEAYEILLWLGNTIDPGSEWSRQATSELERIDESMSYDQLARWAIGGDHDLDMDYYSRGRGELTHRRITPISLEAETYLHAYCHLRHDERVFRLSRIAELGPVGGWSKYRRQLGDDGDDGDHAGSTPATPAAQSSTGAAADSDAADAPGNDTVDDSQMSLLDS